MVLTKLGLVLALLLYHAWTWTVRSAVEGELARIRAAGEPITYADLAASYRIPEGAIDASKEWSAVVEYFGKEDFKAARRASIPLFDPAKEIPAIGADWPELPDVSRLVAAHEEGLRLIATAAGKEGEARFPIAFEKGNNAQLPHLDALWNAKKLLELGCHRALREKKFDQATDCIRLGFALGRALEMEPLIIGQVIHLSIREQQCRLIPLLMSATTIEEQELERWRDELIEFDHEGVLLRAFQGERVNAIQAYGIPDQFEGESHEADRYWTLNSAHPVRLHCYLNAARAANNSIKSNFIEAVDLLWKIENWRFATDVSEYEYYRRGYLRRAAFGFGTFAAGLGRTVTHCRATAALIAAEQFRRKHKRWPKLIVELAPDFLPETPQDPFRAKRLALRVEEKRIIVYGFGFNEEDEFGQPDWLEKDDVAILEIAR
jgi:hypothetical protein